jgi:hypothetical protein
MFNVSAVEMVYYRYDILHHSERALRGTYRKAAYKCAWKIRKKSRAQAQTAQESKPVLSLFS